MKTALIAVLFGFISINAFAEGPILVCKATREGPRSNGQDGYERIDEKTIVTVIDSHIKTTQMIGAIVKTYVNAKGQYMLVLSDDDIQASSTSMGTIDNKDIELGLSNKSYSNFVTCEVR